MLIVFSGTDGAGKSTQIHALSEVLQKAGYRTKYLWARGGYTPFMLKLKAMLLRPLGRKGNSQNFDKQKSAQYVDRRAGMMRRPFIARVWLLLAIIDLGLFYGIYLRILSLIGRVVICDRYVGDTRIDFERNFPEYFCRDGLLWRFLDWFAPSPNLYFVLTVPVELSLARSRLKNEPFPDDEETLAFRFHQYCNAPEFNSAQTIHIDGSAPLEVVTQKVIDAASRVPNLKLSA